jgi:hypothetical protein
MSKQPKISQNYFLSNNAKKQIILFITDSMLHNVPFQVPRTHAIACLILRFIFWQRMLREKNLFYRFDLESIL